MNVLLIEDSPTEQILFREHLAEVNLLMASVLQVASSIAEGKAALESTDVVVIDLTLPDADSDQAFEWIKKICNEKPVIIISGTADPKHIVLSGRLGVGFIPKSGMTTEHLYVEILRAQGALAERQLRRRLLTESNTVLSRPVPEKP